MNDRANLFFVIMAFSKNWTGKALWTGSSVGAIEFGESNACLLVGPSFLDEPLAEPSIVTQVRPRVADEDVYTVSARELSPKLSFKPGVEV